MSARPRHSAQKIPWNRRHQRYVRSSLEDTWSRVLPRQMAGHKPVTRPVNGMSLEEGTNTVPLPLPGGFSNRPGSRGDGGCLLTGIGDSELIMRDNIQEHVPMIDNPSDIPAEALPWRQSESSMTSPTRSVREASCITDVLKIYDPVSDNESHHLGTTRSPSRRSKTIMTTSRNGSRHGV